MIVYEHPLSPYAQKVKIALDEKSIAYEAKMPVAIGSGQPDREFLKSNPRGEVPSLIDGEVAIFDSTIILEYIEDKWPTPASAAEGSGEARTTTHHRGRDGYVVRADQLGPGRDQMVQARGRRTGSHAGGARVQIRRAESMSG
ncbi:MAG: glutathione S-transferase N-terminal domain-containing protein [Rhizomicrobium sp.]